MAFGLYFDAIGALSSDCFDNLKQSTTDKCDKIIAAKYS